MLINLCIFLQTNKALFITYLMTLQLGWYLKKKKNYGNLKSATSLQRSKLHDLSAPHTEVNGLKITDYVMSHRSLLIFKVRKKIGNGSYWLLEEVADFKWTDHIFYQVKVL